MAENIYEIISLGARYWFAFLGLLIVWRAFRWLRKDRNAKHRRLKQLPDAGLIGELVVICGSDELPEGSSLPLPRAGVLGFLRTCDVVVPVSGVAGKHLDFTFQDGKGLLIFPLRGQTCIMDEVELNHKSKTKQHPMHHGSHLEVGEAVLRLRLFAGLDTEYRPYYAYEPACPPEPQWEESPLQPDDPNPWNRPEEPLWQADAQEESWIEPAADQQPYQRQPRSGRRMRDEA